MTSRFSSFGSKLALVAISIGALFITLESSASSSTSSEVVTLRVEDPYASTPPLPSLADFQREMAAFSRYARLPRVDAPLVAFPVGRSELVAGVGPGRSTVTPGRTACERQAVPSRSRRKLRTWERSAEV